MKVLKLLFFYIFSLALSIQFFDWGVYLLDQHSPLINLLGLLFCSGCVVFIWLWFLNLKDDFLPYLKKFKD